MKAKPILPRIAVCVACLVSSAVLYGQTPSSGQTPSDSNSLLSGQAVDQTGSVQNQSSQNKSCSAFALQTANTLTLKQRGCYFTKQLTSPGFALSSVTFAVFDQYRNSPHMQNKSWSMFPHRIETYYARHSARDAGELLVGYLHHEDPRAHSIGVGSFWHRTNKALLSVVTSPDEDGHLRPAYAPLAGSMSSALVGMAMYRRSETVSTTFMHAGVVYGFYFVRSVFAEFKPDLAAMALKIWH